MVDDRFLADLDPLAGLSTSEAFVANEFGHPREIVKNAPYTAEAVTESIQVLPDGPERLAAFREAERIGIAYMPYKYTINRVSLDMTQKHVVGYRRPLFWQDWWQYVDIDTGARGRPGKVPA